MNTLPSINIYCYITICSRLYPDELEDYLLFMNVIDLSSLSAFLICYTIFIQGISPFNDTIRYVSITVFT